MGTFDRAVRSCTAPDAGAVVYTRYGWLKRRMMRRIMAGDSEDIDTSRDYDYTDWDAVEHSPSTSSG